MISFLRVPSVQFTVGVPPRVLQSVVRCNRKAMDSPIQHRQVGNDTQGTAMGLTAKQRRIINCFGAMSHCIHVQLSLRSFDTLVIYPCA